MYNLWRGTPIDEYDDREYVYGNLVQREECISDYFGKVKLDFNGEPIEATVNYIYNQDDDEEYDFKQGMNKVKNIAQSTGKRDKNKEMIFSNDTIKFKWRGVLQTEELIGKLCWNSDELRFEVDILNDKNYTCLSFDVNRISEIEIVKGDVK